MLLTSSWLADILILSTMSIFLLYKYFTRKFNYWKKRGVHYVQPVPFVGNALELCTFKKSMGEWCKGIYNLVDEPFFGIFIFDEPCLILKSPEVIRNVLVKDFDHFMDRTILAPKHNEILANMMFIQKNPDWKKVRAKVSPVFTPAKIKGMIPLIESVAMTMTEYVKLNMHQQLEAKEVFSKYAVDVLAKCAFALDARSFEKEPTKFREVGRAFFDFKWKTAIRQSAYFLRQEWADALRLDFIDAWASEYLEDVFWQAIKLREKTKIPRNDLIDIIIEMRKNDALCKEIQFEGGKVVAQAFMFFAAGFETTSATMAFTLYEICLSPYIQDKLRTEIIDSIKSHGGITYESIQKMKYLDMCVSETLRKYPVLPFLDRTCTRDYQIPGTDVVIEKGMSVYVPMSGLHHDEKYFPEPSKYDPDRFYDKSKFNENGLYYIPFGEGPRVCIGERFGLLITKLALVHILSKYAVEKSVDTPIPIIFEEKSLVMASKGGLPMTFKEICLEDE